MKKAIYAAVAATIAAGSAVAHPKAEAHVCGINPETVVEWPGYGTRGNLYDRGDYFFAVEVENFNTPIAYKHWNKVEAITNHIRIYKDTCEAKVIEIVHPESKPEVEAPAPAASVEPEATGPQLIIGPNWSDSGITSYRDLSGDPNDGKNHKVISGITVDGYAAELHVFEIEDSNGNHLKTRTFLIVKDYQNYTHGSGRYDERKRADVFDNHRTESTSVENTDGRFVDENNNPKKAAANTAYAANRDGSGFSISDTAEWRSK